jgi:hypothetical protein
VQVRPARKQAPQAFFSNGTTLAPGESIAISGRRWQVEVTFSEAWAPSASRHSAVNTLAYGLARVPAAGATLISRLRLDASLHATRHIAGGRSKLETIRCLKRCIGRDVIGLIRSRHREINQDKSRI